MINFYIKNEIKPCMIYIYIFIHTILFYYYKNIIFINLNNFKYILSKLLFTLNILYMGKGRRPNPRTKESSICIYKPKNGCPEYCFYQWVENGKAKRKIKSISKSHTLQEAVKELILYKKEVTQKLGYLPRTTVPKNNNSINIKKHCGKNDYNNAIDNYFKKKEK